MKNLLQRISEGEILVADGAMGTMLMAMDFEIKKCPELMNLARPEILENIALQYLEAGADIIQTNTFGASPLKLALNELEDKTEEINKNAVTAVKKVVGGRAFIAASCGPTGRLLKPFGDTDPDDIYQAFEKQFRYISEIGVNVFCIDTMTDLTEITLAIEAARAVAPQIPVMATMTFDETPRGFFTIMGVSVEKAAEELKKAGADIIGSNCGNGIMNMIKVAREFKNHTDLPVLIQANAGLPELVEGSLVYRESP
jgi:5-methyltetrahydrofolate--homocysteine methyltransferase